MQHSYDITIIGAGLIGCALAIALRNSQWKVALVEANLPPSFENQHSRDMRSLALAYASQQILQKLEIWQPIEQQATPIKRIHISEQGRFGKTVLEAEKLGFPFFGQVMPLPILFQALQDKLNICGNLSLYRPAKVETLQNKNNYWSLTLNHQQCINTKLVIAADGDRSWIRQVLAIPTEINSYQQTAIATTVSLSTPHAGTAYERFTSEGSIALLPLSAQRAGLIFITNSTQANNWLELNNDEFLQKAQQLFGYRLGKLTDLGKRQSHHLQEIHAEQQTLPGLLLLGNAAHTLHPIAAQGFNLGLRDVADLAEIINTATDLSDPILLARYSKQREIDQHQTQKFTKDLIKLFASKFLPLSMMRSAGLQMFDLLPPAQFSFCLRRMGIDA